MAFAAPAIVLPTLAEVAGALPLLAAPGALAAGLIGYEATTGRSAPGIGATTGERESFPDAMRYHPQTQHPQSVNMPSAVKRPAVPRARSSIKRRRMTKSRRAGSKPRRRSSVGRGVTTSRNITRCAVMTVEGAMQEVNTIVGNPTAIAAPAPFGYSLGRKFMWYKSAVQLGEVPDIDQFVGLYREFKPTKLTITIDSSNLPCRSGGGYEDETKRNNLFLPVGPFDVYIVPANDATAAIDWANHDDTKIENYLNTSQRVKKARWMGHPLTLTMPLSQLGEAASGHSSTASNVVYSMKPTWGACEDSAGGLNPTTFYGYDILIAYPGRDNLPYGDTVLTNLPSTTIFNPPRFRFEKRLSLQFRKQKAENLGGN